MNGRNMAISLRRPDDFHLHVRQESLLRAVVPETARVFGRALIMPNTVPPVATAQQVETYRERVREAAAAWPHFEPLMTFKLSELSVGNWDLQAILQAKERGLVAAKYYPEGATTNSEDGVRDARTLYPMFEVMQDADLVLAVHGEDPAAFCLNRESAFLPVFERIARDFPRLRIVLEHVSSREGVEMVRALPATVAATVTLHHLVLTLDDVAGGLLAPHHFCKPVVKSPEDRDSLRAAVFSGNPKFFFGSDSAPHLKESKESAHGSAGIYTAPVLMPALAELFSSFEVIDRLEGFTSSFGADFYRLPRSADRIVLEPAPFTVPDELDGVVPFRAGERLGWTVNG